MTFLQEYDLEFKPTHMVKGYGLCKLATEVVDQSDKELEGWDNDIEMYRKDYASAHDTSYWYIAMKQYLGQGTLPPTFSAKQKTVVRLKVAYY